MRYFCYIYVRFSLQNLNGYHYQSWLILLSISFSTVVHCLKRSSQLQKSSFVELDRLISKIMVSFLSIPFARFFIIFTSSIISDLINFDSWFLPLHHWINLISVQICYILVKYFFKLQRWRSCLNIVFIFRRCLSSTPGLYIRARDRKTHEHRN